MTNKNDRLMQVLLAISISLAGFALAWLFNANADIRLLQKDVERIASDRETDERQDLAIRQHWKIMSHHRTQINALRHRAGLEPMTWPPLGE